MGLAKCVYCIKPDPNKLPHKTLKISANCFEQIRTFAFRYRGIHETRDTLYTSIKRTPPLSSLFVLSSTTHNHRPLSFFFSFPSINEQEIELRKKE